MTKMIFFNVGWMENYQGLEDDRIAGGGSFVDVYNEACEYDKYPPCEIRNFEPYEGRMYGFVRVGGSLNIDRLGASKSDDFVEGVLAVWVAKSPADGTFVVGWYKNATVYRDRQLPPEDSGRQREGRKEWGYRVSARTADCTLLPTERRDLRVPRGGKGSMGQSNVWYADQPENRGFRKRVRQYITRTEQTSRTSPT